MGAKCFYDINKRKNKVQVIKEEKTEEEEKPKEEGEKENEEKIDIQENDNDNLKKFKDKKNMHYIIGYKISLDKDSTFQKENNTKDLSVNK